MGSFHRIPRYIAKRRSTQKTELIQELRTLRTEAHLQSTQLLLVVRQIAQQLAVGRPY